MSHEAMEMAAVPIRRGIIRRGVMPGVLTGAPSYNELETIISGAFSSHS
jgi:hypothetical protein